MYDGLRMNWAVQPHSLDILDAQLIVHDPSGGLTRINADPWRGLQNVAEAIFLDLLPAPFVCGTR